MSAIWKRISARLDVGSWWAARAPSDPLLLLLLAAGDAGRSSVLGIGGTVTLATRMFIIDGPFDRLCNCDRSIRVNALLAVDALGADGEFRSSRTPFVSFQNLPVGRRSGSEFECDRRARPLTSLICAATASTHSSTSAGVDANRLKTREAMIMSNRQGSLGTRFTATIS